MNTNLVAITMPKWGLSMKEGSILKWIKSDGDDRGVLPFFSQLSYSSFSPQEKMTKLKRNIEDIMCKCLTRFTISG